LLAEDDMKSAQKAVNRWTGQVAGVVLVGMGIVGLSLPAPTVPWHCLKDVAVHKLAPIARRSEMGRQFLAVYMEGDAQCHRTI
jgi:hypothetical protein